MLHLQPELDQAADGVRDVRDRLLLGTPLFDGVQHLLVEADDFFHRIDLRPGHSIS